MKSLVFLIDFIKNIYINVVPYVHGAKECTVLLMLLYYLCNKIHIKNYIRSTVLIIVKKNIRKENSGG